MSVLVERIARVRIYIDSLCRARSAGLAPPAPMTFTDVDTSLTTIAFPSRYRFVIYQIPNFVNDDAIHEGETRSLMSFVDVLLAVSDSNRVCRSLMDHSWSRPG
jgi:hypothetical protein